jgi:hypothetical protein
VGQVLGVAEKDVVIDKLLFRHEPVNYRKFSPRTTGFLERLWVSIQRATGTMALPFETCRDGRGRPRNVRLSTEAKYRLQFLLIRPLSGASLVSVV